MSRKKAHGFHVISLSGKMTWAYHSLDMLTRRSVMVLLKLPPLR
jgi:hypothetical protein